MSITLQQLENWMRKVSFELGQEELDEIFYNATIFYEENIRLVDWNSVIDVNAKTRAEITGLINRRQIYICYNCSDKAIDIVIAKSYSHSVYKTAWVLPIFDQSSNGSFLHSLKHSFLGD